MCPAGGARSTGGKKKYIYIHTNSPGPSPEATWGKYEMGGKIHVSAFF